MNPIFIDFEASGLGEDTWPIEVGLAWIGIDGDVHAEGHLIRPEPIWSWDAWSEESAGIHNIPRAQLDDAPAAADVAPWVVRTVGRATVLSGAPPYDQRWLDVLLATIGSPELRIEDYHAAAFSWFGGATAPQLHAPYGTLNQRRVPHRAAEDARGLALAWRAGLHADPRN